MISSSTLNSILLKFQNRDILLDSFEIRVFCYIILKLKIFIIFSQKRNSIKENVIRVKFPLRWLCFLLLDYLFNTCHPSKLKWRELEGFKWKGSWPYILISLLGTNLLQTNGSHGPIYLVLWNNNITYSFWIILGTHLISQYINVCSYE